MKDLSKRPVRQRPPGAPEGSVRCKRCNATGVLPGSTYLSWTYCPDCKGFGFLAPDGTAISVPKRLVYAWKNCLMPVALIVLGLVIAAAALAICPDYLLSFFLSDADAPYELLKAYSKWYASLIAMVVAGAAVVLLFDGLAWRMQMKPHRKPYKNYTLAFMVIYTLIYLCIAGVMLFLYDLPGLLQQSKEDMAQIESGELAEAVVWLHPKAHPDGLPGVYSYQGHPPEPLTRYGGIGEDTNDEWVEFYVPDCLGFSLEEDALYDDNKSIEWNEENARQYCLHYTDHFYLVVSIEPVA